MPCNCLFKDINNKEIAFYKKRIFIFSIISIILIAGVIILIVEIKINSDSKNKEENNNFFSSELFIESKEFISNPDQGFFRSVYITMTPDSFTNKTNKPIDDIYHLRCDISQFSKVSNNRNNFKWP